MAQVSQRSFSTTDVDEAEQSMTSLYDAPMVLAADSTRPFRYEMSSLGDDQATFGHLTYNGTCTSKAVALPDFVVAYAVQGQHRWAVGNEKGVGAVPFVIVPEHEMAVHFSDLELITIAIPPTVVETTIAAISGIERVRFDLDWANELKRDPAYLASTMRYLDRALRPDPASFAEPLIRSEATRLILAVLASTLSVVRFDDTGEARPPGRPRTVRRAMSFMDDNADQPITVNDVAAAVHMSVRGLQSAFKTHVGKSPTEYLRGVRLSAVRAELLRSQPQQRTVEQIARSWGFAHTGRFAGAYRTMYGENPHHTQRF